MNTRTRHENSIRRADPRLGGKFEDALMTLAAFRNGLDWFTDEQIADLRDELIRADWRSNRNAMAMRKGNLSRAMERELA